MKYNPVLRIFRFHLALLALVTFAHNASLRAEPIAHDIIAANIGVEQIGFDNDPLSLVVTNELAIGDFRIRPTANRGDYDVQIGEILSDDVAGGVLITSVRENGRDHGDRSDPQYLGTNFATSHFEAIRDGAVNAGGYFIPIAMTWPNSNSTAVIEFNMNIAAGWFPYTNWIAGYARNSTNANGGVNELFTGSPGLVLGTHFVDLGAGRSVVNLTSLGIDSRTNGVLLVLGAKNEDNYALSQVNVTNGTWNISSKDNGVDGAGLEQDPIAFVYIPRTNTTVVSGRFLGNGTITMFSGETPRFTITPLETGRWELKIAGRSPTNGVLLISPEGGTVQNRDNIVTYQANTAGDGWVIESRDLPGLLPALETPGGGLDAIASFVFIPAPTPGLTITPTSGLQTTEAGGTTNFTVQLDSVPTADVIVTVTSDDTTEGTVSPTTLTFTAADWNIPQTVTVAGADDVTVDGAVSYSVRLALTNSVDSVYAGLSAVVVPVINADNEGGVTVTSTGILSVNESGTTATFSIRLNSRPTADVIVPLTSSDATEASLSTNSLTFTSSNWGEDQTVTVTGVDDAADDGDQTFSIIINATTSSDTGYNGLDPDDLSGSNADNDIAGVTVSPLTLTVAEGGSTNFTVVLTSMPSNDVTISFTSSLDSVGTVSPGAVTFSSINWNIPRTITVSGTDNNTRDGNQSFTITNALTSTDALYAAINPADVTVTAIDNEADLVLSPGVTVYGIGMPGVGIDGRATIIDPDTTNYDGGTLTITLTANATAEDRLEIRNAGTTPGMIGVAGTTVTFGGVEIGTFTGGSGTAPLVVSFNTNATPAAAEALLRVVTFRNISATPSLATRTVSIVLADGDGGTTSTTKTIRAGLPRVIEFQQDADRGYGPYLGAADTQLTEVTPDTALPAGSGANGNPGLFLDWPSPGALNSSQVLLRFDNIVGNGAGQIPTNAIIVSAELVLNMTDTGDGSPLHRMLVPWDETNATWNSVGSGIQTDDIEARTGWDSQIGVADGSGATTTGQVIVGVTPDLQAWVNGETNYGWALPGWPFNTDGTVFSASESTNIAIRPMLRVTWVPAGTASASFRQGVDGYTGAFDTQLRQNNADADLSLGLTLFSDGVSAAGNDESQILLRFENLFGSALGQLPAGAQIHAAILDVASVTADAMGDGGRFHAMLQPWQDTNTWNAFNAGVQPDGIEAATNATVLAGSPSLNPDVQGAFLPFDVTSDVQSWASGSRTNYGWTVLPWVGGANGWAFSSSEAVEERNRPRLRVFYTVTTQVARPTIGLISRSGAVVTFGFRGTPSTTYTVQRATNITGPWGNIGTATTNGDGSGTFTDAASPANAGFYKLVAP